MTNKTAGSVKLPTPPTTAEILIESEELSRGKATLIGNIIDENITEPSHLAIRETLSFYELNEHLITILPIPDRKSLIKQFILDPVAANEFVQSLE